MFREAKKQDIKKDAPKRVSPKNHIYKNYASMLA